MHIMPLKYSCRKISENKIEFDMIFEDHEITKTITNTYTIQNSVVLPTFMVEQLLINLSNLYILISDRKENSIRLYFLYNHNKEMIIVSEGFMNQ